MANIAITQELICLCRAAEITPFIWGAHGIGKSSIVAQAAESLDIDLVDLRCAQLDAVDLRGFPDKGQDGRTHFLPPADFPKEGEGILLLDELNRANPDVLAATFQLVLDRKIGQYTLPSGWSIVCAGNFSGTEYEVNEFDPAFSDRFCHVVLEAGHTTTHEWVDWMMKTHGDAAYSVINFCSMNLHHLEDVQQRDLSFQIKPSRRSWDSVVRGLDRWEKGDYSDQCKHEFLTGLVGRDLASTFMTYQPTLTPKDLVRIGVRRARPKLDRCKRGELSSILWGMISLSQELNHEKQMSGVLLDYCAYLLKEHADLAVAACNAILGLEKTLAGVPGTSVLLTNTRLGRSVAKLQEELGDRGLLMRLAERPQLRNRIADLLNCI